MTYSWLLNSEEVATTPQYTFKASRAGSYQLLLRVINDNGTSEKKTTITVEARTQNLKTSIHTILPIEFLAFEAIPEGLNLVVTKSPSSLYRVSIGEKQKVLFIAATTGTYTLEVSIGEAVAETIEIKVGAPPKLYLPISPRCLTICRARAVCKQASRLLEGRHTRGYGAQSGRVAYR